MNLADASRFRNGFKMFAGASNYGECQLEYLLKRVGNHESSQFPKDLMKQRIVVVVKYTIASCLMSSRIIGRIFSAKLTNNLIRQDRYSPAHTV